MRGQRIVLATALACAAAGTAESGGFNIYEMGARATALGGAFTATADDGSALFYNPAGLAWQDEGYALSLNTSAIVPDSRYTRAAGLTTDLYPGDVSSETASNVFFPSGLYVTLRASERWSGGLGVFTPFGLGVEWDDPESFAGRALSTNANIRGYYLSPVITHRPTDRVAISVGVNFVISELDLDRVQTQRFGTDNAAYNVADVGLSGTSSLAASAAAALMWKPTDDVSIGVNYKGGVNNEFKDGTATFEQIETGIALLDAAVAAQLAASGTGVEARGDLAYPSIVSAGARVDLGGLAVMADFVWFSWSEFDEVVLEFDTPALPDQVLEEYYQDGQQWRAGVEYPLGESLTFMAGFVYDDSPQPVSSVSPLLPDADRLDYSGGLSWTNGKWQIAGAYMFVDFAERSTIVDGVGRNYDSFDGVYDSVAHIGSLGVNVHF